MNFLATLPHVCFIPLLSTFLCHFVPDVLLVRACGCSIVCRWYLLCGYFITACVNPPRDGAFGGFSGILTLVKQLVWLDAWLEHLL